MDNTFTVVCLEPGFAPVMFHHDTMEAAQACLTACEADGCTAKLATDADDAARIWNEMQTQAVATVNPWALDPRPYTEAGALENVRHWLHAARHTSDHHRRVIALNAAASWRQAVMCAR